MSKKAHCMIKPFDKISKDSLGCKDIEVTVVHELLHLLIAPIDTYAENTPANEMIEHIVETLALALVSAKRDEIVK
jgi:hypothetical protein